MAGLKNEKGVHIESLLCALGALAGYSCQAAVRAQAHSAAFIVMPGVQFPAGDPGHSIVMSMNR